jgi:hypothetical protein
MLRGYKPKPSLYMYWNYNVATLFKAMKNIKARRICIMYLEAMTQLNQVKFNLHGIHAWTAQFHSTKTTKVCISHNIITMPTYGSPVASL